MYLKRQLNLIKHEQAKGSLLHCPVIMDGMTVVAVGVASPPRVVEADAVTMMCLAPALKNSFHSKTNFEINLHVN